MILKGIERTEALNKTLGDLRAYARLKALENDVTEVSFELGSAPGDRKIYVHYKYKTDNFTFSVESAK